MPTSYADFLKNYNGQDKRLNELREANKKQFKGKFGKPAPRSMRMRYWRPSDTAVWVRLIPYTPEDPYFTFWQTWVVNQQNGKKLPIICNCHDRTTTEPMPCVPCHTADVDEKPELLPARKDAVTVVELSVFHKVKRKRGNNEFTVYERCKGVDKYNRSICEHCDNDIDTEYGHQYYWTLGYNHKTQLVDLMEEISEACANCGTGEISIWGFACEECGDLIASHKETQLSPQEVEFLRTDQEIVCNSCGHVGPTDQQIECVTRTDPSQPWVDGCDEPRQIENVWDLEFLVRTSGSGNSTSIVIERWRHATEELKPWQLEPMDFPYFLSYMDLTDQATAMGIQNPFADDAQEALESYFKADETPEGGEETTPEKETEEY